MTTVKKYCYGAKAPSEHADLVNDQIHKAHKYKNNLVALERERRGKVEAALKELYPHLLTLESIIEAKAAALAELRKTIADRNKVTRSRTGTASDRAQVKSMVNELKLLRAQRKVLRKECFGSDTWKQHQESIDAWCKVEQKRLRAECELYWGTYLATENTMDSCRSGPPPQFRRWTGDGKIAVQIMHGLSAAEVMEGKDRRLRIVMHGERAGVAWLRVGSDEAKQPIWTTVPFVLHRPLPENGEIRWATLIRRRIGTHYQWELQFDINFGEVLEPDAAQDGSVGVDVGWRVKPEGLRVAYWFAHDGEEGELVIPAERLGRWKYITRLQSYRDLHFDYIRGLLSKWLKGRSVPDWLTEGTQTLSQWKSTARLAALVLNWKKNRFPEDQDPVEDHLAACQEMKLDAKHYGHPVGIFDLLEAWRKKDKHLFDWLAHQRLNNSRWRDDFYRNFAARLRRRYATIKVEDANWTKLMRAPKVEAESGDSQMREWMRVASVGRLIQLLGEKARKFEKVPTEWTTMRCHACGEFTGQVDKAALVHTCSSCGASHDQDQNAARNLLASEPVSPKQPEPLAT